MSTVFLSLGSNIGDRRRFIKNGLDSIANFCEIKRISPIYETKPWGKTGQPDFLNLCIQAETSLLPQHLLEKLKQVEKEAGRIKTVKWGAREIDIDILFYGNTVLDEDGLKLPHPLIEQRAFVLAPLSDIAPGFIHPILKKSVRELTEKTDMNQVRKLVQIMGILNITPDSFSDGGEIKDNQTLRQKVQEIIESGADIIDIGGESTRPGHQKISASEEIKRVLPAIKAVRETSKSIPISIDTQKASVAEAAIRAGANIINDVSALSDENMAAVISRFGCQAILMRNRPLNVGDITGSCANQFEEILKKCEAKGIDKNNIILDPGLGFGDLASGDFSSLPGGDPSANTKLVLSIKDYSHGLPVLIGASRKRFLGEMSGQKDAKKRLDESLAFAVLAKYSGASIIRVHDVPQTIQSL